MTIFFPPELRKSFPWFNKLIEDVAAHGISLQEEINVHNKINALIDVKYSIDTMASKVEQDTDREILEYINRAKRNACSRYGETFDDFWDNNSILIRALCRAWKDITKRKAKEEGKLHKATTKAITTIERDMEGLSYYWMIQCGIYIKIENDLKKLAKEIINAAVDAAMQDVDNKVVGILTKKIFTEREGASGVLQILKEIPDSVMSRVSKEIATKNAYHNLVNDRVNMRNEGGNLIIEKRRLMERESSHLSVPPEYSLTHPDDYSLTPLAYSSSPPPEYSLTHPDDYSLTPLAYSSSPPPEYTHHDGARRNGGNSPSRNSRSTSPEANRSSIRGRRLSQEAIATESTNDGISATGTTANARRSNPGRMGPH